MKKNFLKQSGATSDFDDEVYLVMQKTDAFKTQIQQNQMLEKNQKEENEKARKKWNLLKNMLLAFRLKQGESSHVSFIF